MKEKERRLCAASDLLGFGHYSAYNAVQKEKYLGGAHKATTFSNIAIKALGYYQKPMIEALEKSKRFDTPASIQKLGEYAEPIVDTGESVFTVTGEH